MRSRLQSLLGELTALPRAHFWAILAIMACGTIFYYADSIPWVDTVESSLRLDFARRSVHRILSILPVAYAAFVFGLRGGLLTSSVITALLLPRVFFKSSDVEEAVIETVAFFLIGAFVSWLIDMRNKEKSRHQETIATLEEAQIQLQQSEENLRFYVSQILKAQEGERLRIARELHDDTAQALTGLSRRLDMLVDTLVSKEDHVPPEIPHRIEELRDQSDRILEGVRRFSRDLRPPMLDDLGLLPALKWLATSLEEQDGVGVSFSVLGEPHRLPDETELALFRIAQEALNNVRKHSGASAVELMLDFTGGGLRMMIADNGKGFELPHSTGDLAASGKLGLIGMQERVRLLRGTLAIHSQPDEGTEIEATVPA